MQNIKESYLSVGLFSFDVDPCFYRGLLFFVYCIKKTMSSAWTRKEGQNPEGGLNAKGRASYNKETGGNLKAPVKAGDNPRRVSFAARFAGMDGAMNKPNGEPTRKALALKAWGFASEEAARKFAQLNKKK